MTVLALLAFIGADEKTLDHTAVMVGFAALHVVLFRGGHMLMIRSLHRDMIHNPADAYRETLAELSEGELKRANLGFTSTRLELNGISSSNVAARINPALHIARSYGRPDRRRRLR